MLMFQSLPLMLPSHPELASCISTPEHQSHALIQASHLQMAKSDVAVPFVEIKNFKELSSSMEPDEVALTRVLDTMPKQCSQWGLGQHGNLWVDVPQLLIPP